MKPAIAALDFSRLSDEREKTLINPVDKKYEDCQGCNNDIDDERIFDEIHEFFLDYDNNQEPSAVSATDENAMCTGRTDITCDSTDASDYRFVNMAALHIKYEEPIVTGRTNKSYESSNTYRSCLTDQETIISSSPNDDQKEFLHESTITSTASIDEFNNNNHDIMKAELAIKVEQELQNIYNRKNLRIRKHALVYDCQYIFKGESFCDVYSGKDILESDLRSRLEFFKGGMQESDMNCNDIYIRAGQLAALIKKHLYDKNQLVEKKYIEANTFSKSLKLGFRLSPTLGEKRSTCYLKFVECLEILKAVFNGTIAYCPLYCGRSFANRVSPSTTSNASNTSTSSRAYTRGSAKNVNNINNGALCLSQSHPLYADRHTAGLHSAMMVTHQSSTDDSDMDDVSPLCTPRTSLSSSADSSNHICSPLTPLHMQYIMTYDNRSTADNGSFTGATAASSENWLQALTITDDCDRSVGMKTCTHSTAYYEQQPAVTYAAYSSTSYSPTAVSCFQQPSQQTQQSPSAVPAYTLSLPPTTPQHSYAVCSPSNPKTFMFPLTCDTQTVSSGSAYKRYKPSIQNAYDYISGGTPTSFLMARTYTNVSAAMTEGVAGIASTLAGAAAGAVGGVVGKGTSFEFISPIPSMDDDSTYFC